MKYRISKIKTNDNTIMYLVQYKPHWYSNYHHLFDGLYPRIFTQEDLTKFILCIPNASITFEEPYSYMSIVGKFSMWLNKIFY